MSQAAILFLIAAPETAGPRRSVAAEPGDASDPPDSVNIRLLGGVKPTRISELLWMLSKYRFNRLLLEEFIYVKQR